jgi:hypothetical protein
MKKLFLFSLIFTFSLSAFSNNWQNISSAAPAEVTTELVSSNVESSVIRLTLEGFHQLPVNTPQGEAFVIAVEGATPIQQKGAPDLPKVTSSLIIPDLGVMELEVTHAEYVEYNNILIAPSKGNLTRDIDPSTVPYEFGDIYNTNAFFPADQGMMRDPYIVRDLRGQTVVFHPFRYNPVTKTLRVYTEMTLSATNSGGTGVNPLVRQAPLSEVDYSFSKIYTRHFLNYGNGNRYDPVEEYGNYLIISHGPFMSAMEPFIEWKKQIGYPVEIVDVSTIGNAAAIELFIQDYYDTKGVTFVLLVGDAPQVPTSSTSAGDSDVAYSYVAGNDHYPDLFVGRFSAESVDQLNTQVERTITYEKEPPTDVDWFTICTGIASDQGPGDDGEYDYQHIRNIHDDLLNFTYTYDNELFDGSQGGHDAPGNPTPAQVAEDVNTGTSIINYTGHGSTTSWGSSGFSNGDVNNLVNDNMLPFVWSVACVNGNFKNNTCFAEAWLRATNNGVPTGAIAFLASTINQSWNPPMCGQDEMNDILVESYADNINRTFGALSMHGCMQMNDEYGAQGDEMTDTWTCFGDPSVMVRTAVPADMTVTHDPVLFIGTSQLTVITDVEGARATLTRDGTTLATGVVEGGSVILSFATLNNVGTATLTVTGFNHVPYIADIDIIPAEGPFLVMQDYEINDELGNNNHHADYDELIRLTVILENLGVEEASEGTCTISGNDPYITITDDTEPFGVVPAGETITLTNAFEMLIADNIPDQHKITFTLTSTNGDAQWESLFILTLNAPIIEIESLTVDDSENGNGNGQLDPGERATVTIHYSNSGHTMAKNVQSFLEAQCGVVDVLEPNQVIPGISLLGGANASFDVTVDDDSPEGMPAPFHNRIEFGGYLLEEIFNEKVTPKCEDFETGDFTAYSWQHDGDANWTITNLYPYEGLFSIKSGNIDNNQISAIEISMEVLSDDYISFVRKVSSSSNNKLKFYINNTLMDEWSGTSGGWSTEEYPVTQGMKTFRWVYQKTGSGSGGADCAWLDYIIFPPEMTLTVWAGSNQDVCEGSDADLNATATDFNTVEWQTQGTGTFSDTDILNPVYTPSGDDIANGSVILSITASDNASNSVTDELTLTFMDVPVATDTPVGPDYVTPANQSSVYLIDVIEGADDYIWYLSPADAGEIISHGTQGIVMWTEGYGGMAYISVAAVNQCGEGEVSPELEVTVDNLTGVPGHEQETFDIQIAPNPVRDRFTLSFEGDADEMLDIRIMDLLGNTLVQKRFAAGASGSMQFSVAGLPSGVYLVTAVSTNYKITRKIVKH